jgi:hypothetical protein
MMKRLDYRSPKIALCLTLFASMIAFAQSEKIIFKMAPEPNQTIRTKLVHEMEMDMSFEGDLPTKADASGPTKMVAKMVLSLTQKVGAPDKDGNVTSEVTYDESAFEMTMNGQPMQFGDAASKIAGKKVSITFNRKGDIVDIKIPPDPSLVVEYLKEMMKSIYGNLPNAQIGVGEIVTSPLDFMLLIPITDAPPITVNGQSKFKLASVEKDSICRFAKIDQTADGKLNSVLEIATPEGKVKMKVDFKLSGAGDMAVNLDKGFVRSGDLKTTFGGKIEMANEPIGTKSPALNLQGTMKITIVGSN